MFRGLFSKQTPDPPCSGGNRSRLTLGKSAAISVTATQIFSEQGRKLWKMETKGRVTDKNLFHNAYVLYLLIKSWERNANVRNIFLLLV